MYALNNEDDLSVDLQKGSLDTIYYTLCHYPIAALVPVILLLNQMHNVRDALECAERSEDINQDDVKYFKDINQLILLLDSTLEHRGVDKDYEDTNIYNNVH